MERRIMSIQDIDTTGLYQDVDRNASAKLSARTMNYAAPNHNSTAEYQSSGIPFVAQKGSVGTGVKTTINFPYVTRWVMVNVYTGSNPATLQNDAKVAFSDGGAAAISSGQFIPIPQQQPQPLPCCHREDHPY